MDLEFIGCSQEPEESKKTRRYAKADSEPPHLCLKEGDNVVCHVYTENSGNLSINATLGQALHNYSDREWCAYPLAEYFACRIPSDLSEPVYQSCSIECSLVDAYTMPGSIAFLNITVDVLASYRNMHYLDFTFRQRPHREPVPADEGLVALSVLDLPGHSISC